MQVMVNKKAIEGYGRGAVESEVDYASPHRIIQMLLDGALEKVATAKGCIERNDVVEKKPFYYMGHEYHPRSKK
jgi:flagellar protein FliS